MFFDDDAQWSLLPESSYWVSRGAKSRKYWAGAGTVPATCNCGLTGSCDVMPSKYMCNCDVRDRRNRSVLAFCEPLHFI
jgi:hypothetical protein